MQGYEALWLPGTDHAGIATQLMVERQLAAEGTDRHALGRERFLDRMWSWKDLYHGNIRRQLDQLGASCDWSRERFTLDPGLSRAVREAFARLHREGLIAERIPQHRLQPLRQSPDHRGHQIGLGGEVVDDGAVADPQVPTD